MKKKHLLMLMVLLFSFIAETMPTLVAVHAETTKTELINEKFLTVSYVCEPQDDTNRWRILFSRRSDEENVEQRLKLKVTDEKGEMPDNLSIEKLEKQDEWFIEKQFSDFMEDQIVFDMPKSIKTLNVAVQMDQRNMADESIEKNVRKQQKIFTLVSEISNKKKAEKNEKKQTTSEKQAAETTDTSDTKASSKALMSDSDAFIGPKATSVYSNPQVLNSRMYQPLYVNKPPQYTTDANGIYPHDSWQPTGQNDVRNHQGGYEKDNGWDGRTSWDVAQDNHEYSYIQYGNEKNNPNVGMRKYASETSVKDEFKIKLNVRGNTTYKPGADLVFLLDNSSSMTNTGGGSRQNRKKNTEEAFKSIIDNLKTMYPNNQDGIRIGAHIFSDYVSGAWGTGRNEKQSFPLSDKQANWDDMVAEYKRALPLGHTFTQRGIREAGDIFEDAPDVGARNKFLFVLTDGAPNKSWEPCGEVYDAEMYYNPYYITTFTNVGSKGNYRLGNSLGSVGGQTIFPAIRGGKINSHITTTNSTAKNLKDSAGIEIHTIAVNIASVGAGDHSTEQLKRGLYKMSTKRADRTGDGAADYFFYDVNNSDELVDVFKNWYQTVIRTVDSGKIEDPIGEMFELVGTPTVTEVVKNGVPAIDSSKQPQLDLSDRRKIKVANINLYGNQEIQLEYTVRLKTDDPSYEPNKWYQTNGKTTLQPTPERTTDTLDFGVPSVRGKADKVKIPVAKKWSDSFKNTENYWGHRAREVTAVLQKKSGNSWVEVATKTLTSANNWKEAFTVDEGNTVYRVRELSRTRGYGKPEYNVNEFTVGNLPSQGVEITNTLLTESARFYKYKEDGKTPFTTEKPKFTLTRRSDGRVLATDIEPDDTGQVTINALPMGDFVIEESYVPTGYEKMAAIDLKAVENAAGTGLEITMNGQTALYKATNKLADFKLKIKKTDQAGNELRGASFRLIGTSYDQTSNDGPYFEFTGLRPGEYSLSETVIPNGYQGMKGSVRISISQTGEVTIQAHANVSGSGGVGTPNLIQLTVTNKKRVSQALPSTGGYGTSLFFKVAIGVISTAGGLLGSLYWLHMKRRGS
ncbi:SpaA isopeptide-forming pilin-related protein [Enterococcus sp. DIV0756]|uniref:SpaA isopeptide-forming pilin-related protein n=1 Tax=Enterococcus sp. DIV0756 TaxID=2774636 RepID=UPI003F1E74A0